MNTSLGPLLFELGWEVTCTTTSAQTGDTYTVYLDPRARVLVQGKKKKVKKLCIGDAIQTSEGPITVTNIIRPLFVSTPIGFSKRASIPLINMSAMKEYTKPSYYDISKLETLLQQTGFMYAHKAFDCILLETDNGQQLVLPHSLTNLAADTYYVCKHPTCTRGPILEVY